MSDPSEIYVQGYLGGNTPVSIFTQGWFSVSNFRPLLTPINPFAPTGEDTSKVAVNNDLIIGISPWAQGREGPKPGR